MTENQLYPMSADFYDSSSNSSNPLKCDFYALGLSNSNSSSGLYSLGGNSSQYVLSPTPSHTSTANSPIPQPITISIASPTPIGTANNRNSQTIENNIRNNPMLTNAILIPRNQSNNINNSNQLDHHHHHHHHNLHNNQHQQPLIAELSEYGLDALDASSLSPTLLHDVSLTATSPMPSTHSVTPNGNDSYYRNSPTISNCSDIAIISVEDNTGGGGGGGGGGGSGGQSCPNDSGFGSVGGSHNASSFMVNCERNETDCGQNSNQTLFEGHHHVTPNSNTMWSDIGSAIVSMKNEPFNMDDDYIFPNDKIEIQSSNFADINEATFLEVIGSIEEFIPNGSDSALFLSPTSSASGESGSGSLQQLSSPQMSPVGGPPPQLLQQNLQHQNQLRQQFQQQQQQQPQQQQNSHHIQILQQHSQQTHHHSSNSSYDEGHHVSRHHHHHHHVSSSPYEIYHSTPSKQQLQQQNNSASTFSPGSQTSSQSPLLFNSTTPPPLPPSSHINHRSHYQSSNLLKSRNVQDMLKQEFSMSPDRNNVAPPIGGSHIALSGIPLSPNSGTGGFGGSIFGSNGAGNGISAISNVRKAFVYQADTTNATTSRLSSSAPTQTGLEQIWLRREPRQHLLSTGSLAEAESFSSISTGSVLSPDGVDFSHDDEEDASSDYNSDHYDDFSSDNGSDNEDDNNRHATLNQSLSSKNKERFFWQYNVQAKGPKGKRLVFQSKLEDPHVLNEVTDPVFSPNCSVRGIKHSGKARKGDGNDLTPNPKKLHSIGRELDKLSRTINDMTPVSELPFNIRPKSRKEKNKLASRACRLKKKAQHEANKIKLHGLEIEHKKLLSGIAEIKQLLALKYQNQKCVDASLREEFDQEIEKIYKNATNVRIAGETADFVNQVLDNIKSGVNNGGLEDLRKLSS